MSTSGCSEEEQSLRKDILNDCAAMGAGLVKSIRNHVMRLKQLVTVDRLSSVQGDRAVEEHVLGGGWSMVDFTGEEPVRRALLEEMAYIHNKKVIL